MTPEHRMILADACIERLPRGMLGGYLPTVKEFSEARDAAIFLGRMFTAALIVGLCFKYHSSRPETDEFEGMTNEEKKATLEARINTALSEYNSKLPVYEPK